MVTADRPPKILIVEDEPALADSVRYVLEMEGFEVAIAETGRTGLEVARQGQVNLVLLDLMLPEMSGLDVCRHIRAISDVPIIVLTAKDSEADKVAGLELGADDYVTKPFSMRELLSRVRAALRRYDMRDPVNGGEVLRASTVEMDIDRHEVRVGGSLVPLRPKEFELLEALIRRKDRLVTREILIEEVWGPHYFGDTKTLDVHIKRLRQKLEPDPHRPALITTVRGLGYKLIDA
ncbi:MAG TPA: response regulator transcription factor [Acidimicrobiia bacterium]|jgi:two-component system response regulator RegX3|nr:response regulator transcription factor [Acidimicrobiia bacterium]